MEAIEKQRNERTWKRSGKGRRRGIRGLEKSRITER